MTRTGLKTRRSLSTLPVAERSEKVADADTPIPTDTHTPTWVGRRRKEEGFFGYCTPHVTEMRKFLNAA